jgi:hypothetical protein
MIAINDLHRLLPAWQAFSAHRDRADRNAAHHRRMVEKLKALLDIAGVTSPTPRWI